ncbi:ribosomal protein S6 [Cyathus striatus]|nr:ribosomal protein S6 [Cyathus striatus]
MPLYQLICITTHYQEFRHIRELVRQSALHVMNAGGVVRSINSWGTQKLPQRMKRYGKYEEIGDYWSLHFDTNPRTLRSLNGIMRRDPRILRWSVMKLGEKAEDIAKAGELAQARQLTVEHVVD